MTYKIKNIERETIKAIAVKAVIIEECSDQAIYRLAWFPKSQIIDNEIPAWLMNAKHDQLIDENRMPVSGGCYDVDFIGIESVA